MELAFPEFISPIVWNMCENLHYESSVVNRYISKSYTTSKNSIGRGQLWCQLLLVIVTVDSLQGKQKKRYELPEIRVIEDKIIQEMIQREMKIASSQREVRVIVALKTSGLHINQLLRNIQAVHVTSRCQGLFPTHRFFKGKALVTRWELQKVRVTGSRLYVYGPGLLTLYVIKFADLIKIQ